MGVTWPRSVAVHHALYLSALAALCLITPASSHVIGKIGNQNNQPQINLLQNDQQQSSFQHAPIQQQKTFTEVLKFNAPILESQNILGQNSQDAMGQNSQNALGLRPKDAPGLSGNLIRDIQIQNEFEQKQEHLGLNEKVDDLDQSKKLVNNEDIVQQPVQNQNFQNSQDNIPIVKANENGNTYKDYAKGLDGLSVDRAGQDQINDKPAELNFEVNNQGHSKSGIAVEVQKDKVIGRLIEADDGTGRKLPVEKTTKSTFGTSGKVNNNVVTRKDINNDINPHVVEGLDGRSAFDVAESAKAVDGNSNVVTSVKDDLFDKKNENGIPDPVKIIDGEVEKFKSSDINVIDSRNYQQKEGGAEDRYPFPAVRSNEIPRNIDPVEAYRKSGAQVGNNSPAQSEEEKPGSLRVVWDWSDFAVNFEQYVMPEQKIRRAPHATTGEPWPMPQYYVSKKDKVYQIDRSSFRFEISKIKCDIIEKAVERYKPYILEDPVEDMYDNFQHAQSTMFEEPSAKYETPLYLEAPAVPRVLIKIRKPCTKLPSAKSDESYDLFVKRTGIHIWANEVWGALRGLETLSQLVFKGSNQLLYIRDTVINDYPRFSHRGLLIDSSRHFIFKETIYDVLEGMAQNKMNVLHWHIVDDQSFPFYSNAYPDLSAKGAFHPSFVYMPEDVADIIEFARLRGIRVQPEFDTPGHTYSWGLSRPDLLTQCYQGDRPVDGYLGPMDPSKNETFRFLKNFFKDVLHTFKDQYLHLGGDEVPMTCWQSNTEITKFLAKLEGRQDSEVRNTDSHYYSYDIRKVLEYYVTRVIKDLKSLAAKRANGLRLVFWQEIMNNNVQLPNDTIIQVWQGGMEEVERAISLGLNVIYSTCWYLDLIEYGTKWSKYYQCDPADTSYGFTIDESKVLGGEACLWAEYIDNENLMTTLWPRASATAERLWSSKDVRDLDSAAARLQEHRCRMLSRGLGVGQISGPDYCLRRGKRRHNVNETMSSSNCTYAQCAAFSDKGRVEVENIKVEFEQKGGHMSDCSQAVLHAGGQLTIVILLLVLVAIAVALTFTKKKIAQVRICKNKTILMVFITLILIYFMCYTTIWVQAMEFKGSFEKRISSKQT